MPSASDNPVQFMTLLKLTTRGRDSAERASESLLGLTARVEEIGGHCHTVMMTYGAYDAMLAGDVPDLDALMRLLAATQEDGVYVTDTHVGYHPKEWKLPTPRHHTGKRHH